MAASEHLKGSYVIQDTDLTYSYMVNYNDQHFTLVTQTNGTAYGTEYKEIDLNIQHNHGNNDERYSNYITVTPNSDSFFGIMPNPGLFNAVGCGEG